MVALKIVDQSMLKSPPPIQVSELSHIFKKVSLLSEEIIHCLLARGIILTIFFKWYNMTYFGTKDYKNQNKAK